MSFDITKLLALIKGGLFDPQNTWTSYLGENPDWRQTAINLTGPLLILNVVLTLIFSRMSGSYMYFGYGQGFLAALVTGLVMSAIGFAIVVLVFNFLAGVFKGKSNFSRAFAAISLAAIPGWLAGIVGSVIPWIGWLIGLAGAILSLVYVYRIMPLALEVPEDKRVVHFVSSLISVIIVNFILGAVLGLGSMGRQVSPGDFSARDSRPTAFGSGLVGEIERQGLLVEAAQSDRYEPPADGKLSEAQVENYISILRKTRDLQQEYSKDMQALGEEIEAKEKAGETVTPGDFARMYGGVGTALGAHNAEMEVVKTGGGNWAEHQWIKQQLRIARIQQGEGNDAIKHNYELFKEYEEALKEAQ